MTELLATLQGYQLGPKTMRDLMNCIQRDDETLLEYLERFIQIKAQVSNLSEAMAIAASIEGLAIGQCAVLVVLNDQIRLPIKTQKEEK